MFHRYSWCGGWQPYFFLDKFSEHGQSRKCIWTGVKQMLKLPKIKLEDKLLHIVHTGFWPTHPVPSRYRERFLPQYDGRPECVADISLCCSVETESAWNCISLPPTGMSSWLYFSLCNGPNTGSEKKLPSSAPCTPLYLRGRGWEENLCVFGDRGKPKNLIGKLTPPTNHSPQILHKIALILTEAWLETNIKPLLKLSILYIFFCQSTPFVNTILKKHNQHVSVQVYHLQSEIIPVYNTSCLWKAVNLRFFSQ
jgi:hypothetical protein